MSRRGMSLMPVTLTSAAAPSTPEEGVDMAADVIVGWPEQVTGGEELKKEWRR